jgi:hypothetical protein
MSPARLLRSFGVLAMVALLSLAGCAYQPDFSTTPDLKDIDTSRGPAPTYRDAITAAPVSGGKDDHLFSVPNISNKEFQASLVRTLLNAKLASASNGRYRLDATLKLDQPFITINTTVTAIVAYRLTDVATGTVVYDKTLETPGTAQYMEIAVASERMKLANARALKANLRRLVEELYALPDSPASTPRS